MNQQVTVDYNEFENNFDYQDLHNAVAKLMAATEKDFEQIKNEKWYTRVFDLVTFSNKKDIRLANQITNVAQAQEILMEILVRLSQRDAQLSELVQDAFTNIERLSAQDVQLATRLRELEQQYLLGIGKDLTIEDLNDLEKKILAGLLLQCMTGYEVTSSNQQIYADELLAYLQVKPENINKLAAINELEHLPIRKFIYMSLMEYAFLYQFSFEFPNEVEDILDEFDFGRKTFREIREQIQMIYKLRGANGFVGRYDTSVLLSDSFEVEFEEVDGDIKTAEIVEREDFHVSSIMTIPSGEQLTITNKNIFLNSYIKVDGELVLKNCNLYYTEITLGDITVSDSGKLKIFDSLIMCDEAKDKFMIKAGKDVEISFTRTKLANPSTLVSMGENYNLVLSECTILHPGPHFIYANSYKNGHAEFIDCEFHMHYEKATEKTYITPPAIIELTSEAKAFFSNCKFFGDLIEIEESSEGIDPLYQSCILQVRNIELYDCEFICCLKIFWGGGIFYDSDFTRCMSLFDSTSYEARSVYQNLKIKGCTNVFSGSSYKVKECKVSKCDGEIASGDDAIFEFNEFEGINNTDDTLLPKASFEFSIGKHSGDVHFKKCIFDGFKSVIAPLIYGNTYESIKGYKVYVDNCDFRNCKVQNGGPIVKRTSTYFGLFDRLKDTTPMYVTNCRGL